MPAPVKHFLTVRRQQGESGTFKESLSLVIPVLFSNWPGLWTIKMLTDAIGLRVLVTNAVNDLE